jgi:P pilus assembly chaperone PapD
MNPSDQADAFRINMLSCPAVDSEDDEETEGLALAIETGDLVYDPEAEILTNTKNAERVRIMTGGTFQLLP